MTGNSVNAGDDKKRRNGSEGGEQKDVSGKSRKSWTGTGTTADGDTMLPR